ncbi:MAG: NAD-binding protein, partial [Odoribacter sp.]|nr:NAD-binding protein [Odoribacter sp.]
MKCIIIGLGNFGMTLAQQLTDMGYEVIGVDKDMDKVNGYKDSIKNTICLNLNNEQAARNLPLRDADLSIVTLGKDIGASVLTVAI